MSSRGPTARMFILSHPSYVVQMAVIDWATSPTTPQPPFDCYTPTYTLHWKREADMPTTAMPIIGRIPIAA